MSSITVTAKRGDFSECDAIVGHEVGPTIACHLVTGGSWAERRSRAAAIGREIFARGGSFNINAGAACTRVHEFA